MNLSTSKQSLALKVENHFDALMFNSEEQNYLINVDTDHEVGYCKSLGFVNMVVTTIFFLKILCDDIVLKKWCNSIVKERMYFECKCKN